MGSELIDGDKVKWKALTLEARARAKMSFTLMVKYGPFKTKILQLGFAVFSLIDHAGHIRFCESFQMVQKKHILWRYIIKICAR